MFWLFILIEVYYTINSFDAKPLAELLLGKDSPFCCYLAYFTFTITALKKQPSNITSGNMLESNF